MVERASGSTQPLPTELSEQLARAVIAVSVHCRGCGYNLHGLDGDSKCPECGLPVGSSIQAIIDPEGSRLPRLADPRGVGNGLFWFILCALLASILLGVEPLLSTFRTVAPRAWTWAGLVVPRDLSLLAGAVALASAWSVYRLWPRSGREAGSAVLRDVWLLAIGIAAFGTLTVCLWWRQRVLPPPWGARIRVDFWLSTFYVLISLASVVALLGIGGVIRTIGFRSLEYRRSKATRQSVHAMVAAVGGVTVGEIGRSIAKTRSVHDRPLELWTVCIFACAAMAVIGLCYLLLNAWWIRRALCRPPPTLGQLLLPALPADTHVPDTDFENPAKVGPEAEIPDEPGAEGKEIQ